MRPTNQAPQRPSQQGGTQLYCLIWQNPLLQGPVLNLQNPVPWPLGLALLQDPQTPGFAWASSQHMNPSLSSQKQHNVPMVPDRGYYTGKHMEKWVWRFNLVGSHILRARIRFFRTDWKDFLLCLLLLYVSVRNSLLTERRRSSSL